MLNKLDIKYILAYILFVAHYFALNGGWVMDMSYQEKSILGSLLAMVVVYSVLLRRLALRDIGRAEFDGGSLGG